MYYYRNIFYEIIIYANIGGFEMASTYSIPPLYEDEIEAVGGELLVIKRFEGNSTTSLIRRFLARTEISDLLLIPKHKTKGYVAEDAAEDQAGWHQLRLPLDSVEMD